MRIGLGLIGLVLAAAAAACSRNAGGQTLSPSARAPLSSTTVQAGVPSEAIYNPCPPSVTTCLIMPLGDSLTSGATDEADGGYRGELFRSLQRLGRPFDFVGSIKAPPGSGHEGHPGAHISLLDSYAEIWLPAFKPHVILMMIGTNDLDFYISMRVAQYAAKLDQMFTLLPDSLIVAAAVPPSGLNDATAIEFNRQLLEMIKTKAAAGKHVVAVDMHSAVQMRDIGPDRVHLFHSGYVKLAAVWYSALDRFMRRAP